MNKLIGKIGGVVGLILLLSSPYTVFTASGHTWLIGGKIALGLVLVVLYLVTHWGSFGQVASRKSTAYLVLSIVSGVLLVGGLVGANYWAFKKNKSWDLTRQKIYSLAPQTTSTLTGLKDKVTAIAFLPSSNPYYDLLEDLLSRYQREAPDKFSYVFKDPKKNPDLAAKYQLKEGQTTVVLVRGEGAKESHTTLNVLSEQELTNALIKLNAVGEQKAYFVVGHGEWPLDGKGLPPEQQGASLSELKTSLQQEGYTAETLNLAGKTEVPRDAALVVVAGAKSRLTDSDEQVLDKYLSEGGRMMVFAEAQVDGGLDKLLAKYGVQVDNGIVADRQFAVESPYNVVSLFYGEHEITDILKKLQMNVQLPTPRGLSVLHEGLLDGVDAKPVVLSSPFAWEELTPNDRPEPNDGEKQGQLPLVVASTRKTTVTSNKRFDEARLVVFGDSELLVNANWGIEGNRNLVMNAFGWTTNQTSRITIRPPDRDISTVDLDHDMITKMRFAATDVVPMILLAMGAIIWQARRNK